MRRRKEPTVRIVNGVIVKEGEDITDSEHQRANEAVNSTPASNGIPSAGEELKCPICLDYLEGACETSCGHCFCASCLTDYLCRPMQGTAHINRCPVCRMLITFVHPSFVLRKLVDSHLEKLSPETRRTQRGGQTNQSAIDARLHEVFQAQLALLHTDQLEQQARQQALQQRREEQRMGKLVLKVLSLLIIALFTSWYLIRHFRDVDKPPPPIPSPTPPPANVQYTRPPSPPPIYSSATPSPTGPKHSGTPPPEWPEGSELQKQLFTAATVGDAKQLASLLRSGHAIDVNFRGPLGVGLLFTAAHRGHLEVVQLLVEEFHADINVQTDQKATPLLVAAEYGRADVVKYLLTKNAAVDLAMEGGFTPLMAAAKNGHTDVVKALLDAGSNPNAATFQGLRGLHVAAENGHLEAARVLLAARAEVDAQTNFSITPLYVSARAGHLAVVEELIEQWGAKVDVASVENATPLYVAAEYGRTAVVKALVEKYGAAVEARMRSGATPLVIAAQNGHSQIVEFLLANGADTAAVGAGHAGPLAVAVMGKHTDIVQQLLAAGANPDAASDSGPPLVLAGRGGLANARVVSLLLAYGADYTAAGVREALVDGQLGHMLEGVRRIQCKLVPLPLVDSTANDPLELEKTTLTLNSVSRLAELAVRTEAAYGRLYQVVEFIDDDGAKYPTDAPASMRMAVADLAGKRSALTLRVAMATRAPKQPSSMAARAGPGSPGKAKPRTKAGTK